MKKILVTGGFGFIGSTLVELLVKNKKNKVHVIDDMSSSPIVIADYLKTIGQPKNLSYDITTVERFMTQKNVGRWNEIYHLASPVGPAGVLKHSGNMVRNIVRDAYLLVDYCLKHRIKLLDVSTSEIYGGGQGGHCPESSPKIVSAKTSPRLEYAVAKLAVETAIINTCSAKGLRATIIRPFNVAGKRQSITGGFVLPRFIQQAHNGKPVTVFGDGQAIRAFTNVKDMAQGIILGMQKGQNGEAYNIGSLKNKIRIIDLAKKVKKTLNSQSQIILVDPKKIFGNYYEEANDKFPDEKKAKKELGWKPKYDISVTIREAKDEYLRQLAADVLKDHI